MRSKGNAPTAAQKRWMEAVRELGSVISGCPAVVHHAIGRSAKIKGVGNLGHWFLIPLTDKEHRDLHNGWNIWEQSHPDMFETRKEFEKGAFKYDVLDKLLDIPDEFTYDIHYAIMEYHR